MAPDSFTSCGCPVVHPRGSQHRINCPRLKWLREGTAYAVAHSPVRRIENADQPVSGAGIAMPSEAFQAESNDVFRGASVDLEALEYCGRLLLRALGEDLQREGLKDTPLRFARMWAEFIDYDPGRTDTAFSSVQTDQMVVVGPMRVWSKCEHHLVDFWADITVGYIVSDHALGLSKFARIAHKHAHRLQIQEQLVADIAAELTAACGTDNVAVFARGEHLCMVSRGIRTPAGMYSSSLHGAFKANPETRREFLSLATGDHSR